MTGTSSALEGTFRMVKGCLLEQRPATTLPPSLQQPEWCAFLGLQPQGGFPSKPMGPIGGPGCVGRPPCWRPAAARHLTSAFFRCEMG